MAGQDFSFSLYKLLAFRVFFALHGVAVSSLVVLHDWVSVESPFFTSGHVIPLFTCYSVKLFHVGPRVSRFVHARLTLLVLEVALHDRSIISFVRGNLVIICSFEFL